MPKKPTSTKPTTTTRRRSSAPPPPLSLEELMASHLSQAMDQMFQAVLGRLFPQQSAGAPSPPDPPTPAPKPTKPRHSNPTLYDLLGVSPHAPQEVINGAWRALSKKHHPDREGGSEEMIKKLNMAHDLLSDPQKRKQYDQMIGIK